MLHRSILESERVTIETEGLPNIVAVVPALNEAPSIEGVVEKLLAQELLTGGVLVVDNGSDDGTGEIAARVGARVAREERRGYGYACRAGVKAVEYAEVVVLLDGDAADDPEDLRLVLAPILEDAADLVVGSRVLGTKARGSMTVQQVFGNRLATFLMRDIYGMRVTDLGPFRAIRREKLLALDMREMTYGWSVEMMVKATLAGYRCREVPVRYHRRVGTSKVGGTLKGSVKAGYSIITTTLRYASWKPGR